MIGTGEKGTRKLRLSNWVTRAMALGLLLGVSPALAAGTGPDATPSSIDLSGSWRFKLDNVHPDGTASDFGRDYAKPGDLTPAQERDRKGHGLELGYHQAAFDDSDWGGLEVPGTWGAQGHRRASGKPYYGPAWYRRTVVVPAEWQGAPVQLQLGQPDDCGTVYWNGEEVARIAKFGPHFNVMLKPGQIKFGQKNVIAVSVSNQYKEGGLIAGTFRLAAVRPFAQSGGAAAERMALSVDKDLPPVLTDGPDWRPGWRDEGTSDTRPRMTCAKGAYRGRDAVRMEVWFPNSTEMVDYRLPVGERGSVWRARGFDYIAFRVKSDVAGEMQMRLNKGDIRWKHGGPSYQARFHVAPDDWTRVILPFTAFLQKEEPLADTSAIDTLAIGYGNNELQGKGTVLFADFEVGRFDLPATVRPVSLEGMWFFRKDDRRPDGQPSDLKDNPVDKQGHGRALGYADPEYDHAGWELLQVGTSWESQGVAYDGPAWYRQRVWIPAEWAGRPLAYRLGKPDDRGTVFWNGAEVQTVESFGPDFAGVLEPGLIRYGAINTVAVLIHDWYRGGGLGGTSFWVGPELETLAVRWRDEGVAGERAFEDFDPGPLPPAGREAEAVVRFPAAIAAKEGLTLNLRLMDCFHATVAVADIPLKRAASGEWEAVLRLGPEEARKLYYGEWIDVRGLLAAADGAPVTSFARHRVKLRYAQRDALALPELPETFEETPLGRLKLVDVIDAGAAPELGEHPYKEGGVRDFWGGRRAYSPWLKGVVVNELQGVRYREANDSRNFGYRIGRGRMKPGTQYLLRIRYPEDKTRYFAMDIKAGRNYQGVGFRTGVAAGDPFTPYPLSGGYEWCDHVVSLDDVTYGWQGKRSTSSENGFWVFFHDIGRVYSAQYESGPAIAEMRLYEITDPAKHDPVIRYPEGQPRRLLMMDWERQPEADPEAVAEYARLVGLNAVGPLFLKWAFNGYFPNTLGYNGAPEWYGTPVHRDGFGNSNCWRVAESWLKATREHGLTIVPRLEYGGSPQLPKEARVIGPNGKVDPCGRYTSWGANLLHPATFEDFKTTLDEAVGRYAADYPNLGGFLWRMRSDRMKCSYGLQDVEMFCQETGREMPKGDAAAIAKWASQTVAADYETWWHAKRRDFHVRVRDLLRSYRPDLKLYYYNWDPDGWNLQPGDNAFNTAQDWTDRYNVHASRKVYERRLESIKKLGPEDYLRTFVEGRHALVNEPHKRLRPALYRDVAGIALFAPVHWDYLSDNEPYIQSFATGDGLAVCNQYHYEEKARTNIQGDNYETSEMTPAGPSFAMAEEVLSFFHGDPNVITWTPYTIGRSFIAEHRRFAQAYLSLPAATGKVVEGAVSGPAGRDVRVRTYPVGRDVTYVSVAHRGYAPATFTVALPGMPAGAVVTDLVTGETVPATIRDGALAFTVSSRAMELNSYRIDVR